MYVCIEYIQVLLQGFLQLFLKEFLQECILEFILMTHSTHFYTAVFKLHRTIFSASCCLVAKVWFTRKT